MKKSLKSKSLVRLAMLVLFIGSMGASSIAKAQSDQIQNDQMDSYSVWCDQVTQNLMQAQSLGWNLYHRQLYVQSKNQILSALQSALNSMNIPGGRFRPATYREIVRTISLVNALENTQPSLPGSNNPALKAKMIAYIALQRISFISYVKDAVDVDYNIPCRRGCGGYGYENPEYESALANVAAEQLSRAQDYSSIVGSDGMVYPINDTPYYFVVIANAANWAAEDLSMSLFSKRFSCAVLDLRNLGSRARSYQAMLGDISAVQEIHEIVESLVNDMSESPRGCGHRR